MTNIVSTLSFWFTISNWRVIENTHIPQEIDLIVLETTCEFSCVIWQSYKTFIIWTIIQHTRKRSCAKDKPWGHTVLFGVHRRSAFETSDSFSKISSSYYDFYFYISYWSIYEIYEIRRITWLRFEKTVTSNITVKKSPEKLKKPEDDRKSLLMSFLLVKSETTFDILDNNPRYDRNNLDFYKQFYKSF